MNEAKILNNILEFMLKNDIDDNAYTRKKKAELDLVRRRIELLKSKGDFATAEKLTQKIKLIYNDIVEYNNYHGHLISSIND